MNDANPLAGFPTAEAWSLTTGQIGKYLVLAGLLFFAVAAVFGLLSARKPAFGKPAAIGFTLGSLTLFGAFACLATLFAKNQFQYEYVFEHGDVHTALQYKIAGVWSGQQGSFLLWATTSAIFGLLTLRGTGKYRANYVSAYSIFLATLCGILAYETPFGLLKDVIQDGKVFVPPSGQGLAPSLMNYWVVIHPPTIFMGFGSLTVLFAYTISAIFTGDLNDWISRVRPWALVSTAILGLGICMGGFWAYETLGWGGFWGWDPVENASFIPWIFVVAFVHGIIVQTAKKRWHGSNLWLGAAPFLTFTYGTFLTRGGYLDKVSNHSFASMEKSALVILMIFLIAVVVGFIALYLWRGRGLAKAADSPVATEPGIHRESLYSAGVLLLSLTATVLALGMSWPLLVALTGHEATQKIEEGPYHKALVWFFLPIMVGIAVTPYVGWRTLGGRELVRRVANVFSFSVALTGLTLLALRVPEWGTTASATATVAMPFGFRMAAVPWIAVLLLVCAFAFVANAWRAIETFRKGGKSLGGFVAHLGIATLFAGMILSRGLEQKEMLQMVPGETQSALGYKIQYAGMTGKDMYDRDGKAKFNVTTPTGETFTATPGLYYRPAMGDGDESAMVWPYIRHYGAHDFYFSLGIPITTVWEKPQWFHKGESKTLDGITVTYRNMTIEGEPGTPSASFGTNLLVSLDGNTYPVTPHFTVANGPDIPMVGSQLRVAIERIDAADQSALLQLYFAVPRYPVELFTKPLTGLVWAGAGILTLGGLLSAFSRRRPKTMPTAVSIESET